VTPLARIEALLSRSVGLDRRSIGLPSFERAIEERRAACGASDWATFADRLEQSAEDLQDLVEQIVVPETWFFRDEHPFRFLARWCSARASRLGPGRVLRVLSIPCSTGEEPYSIAITLIDRGLPAGTFSIDAIDVSRRALATAREGRYGSRSFRGALGFRARHLTPDGAEHYRVSQQLRESVRFLAGNIADARLLVWAAPYDVVFCRNILIYLDDRARSTALATLDRLLADDGILIAGHADGIDDARFRSLPEPGAFAYQRARREPIPARVSVAPATKPPVRAAVRVEKHPLELAAELANAERFEEAAALCEEQLTRDRNEPEGYSLLGAIYVAEGRLEAAEDCLQRALYLDRNHYDALIQLALLCERRGDPKTAARMRRRAKRAARETGTR
jgi:chemotaxis protein methyltransferase WspC